MSARTFTGAQERAVTLIDRHLAVSAGPGSGKTSVLVGRYLEALDAGDAQVEEIWAVTYTRKAAVEMRERVRAEIRRRERSARDLAARALWRRRRKRLDWAVIGTIHGLCSRLLREDPLEAGVDPRFVTLDEYASSRMLATAAAEAASALAGTPEPAAELLASAFRRRRLAGALSDAYLRLRAAGLSIEEIDRATADTLATAPDWAAVVAELSVSIGALTGAGSASRAIAERVAPLRAAWEAARGALEGPPGPAGVRAALRALDGLSAAAPRAAGAVKPLVADLRAALDATRGAYLDRLLADHYAPAFFRALAELDRAYATEKRAVGGLDYDDLQFAVRDLFARSPGALERARRRVRHLLVDEWQDANALQKAVLAPLAEGPSGARLFVVGDQKQSIYGFRGADVDVFAETALEIEARGGEHVRLDVNFRADARLVSLEREVFSRLMVAGRTAAIDGLGAVAYEPSSASRPAEGAGPAAELLLVEASAGRAGEAARLAHRLAEIARSGRPFGDMAVLLRSMGAVAVYEAALEAEGVPYVTIGGTGFWDRQEVQDLVSLVAATSDPGDELALAVAARSPLAGVSGRALAAARALWPEPPLAEALARLGRGEARAAGVDPSDEHACSRFVRLLESLGGVGAREGVAALIGRALGATGYSAASAAAPDGVERIANVRKLLALAREYDGRGDAAPDHFVAFVRESLAAGARETRALADSVGDRVVLMTVHKAKGLEFPVVAIADSHHERPRRDEDVLVDRRLGLAIRVPEGTGRLARPRLFDTIAARTSDREANESLRLLFVAMTRARDRLLVSGVLTERSLGRRLGVEACSWLEWLLGALDVDPQAGTSLAAPDLVEVSVEGPEANAQPARDEEPIRGGAPEGRAPAASRLDLEHAVIRVRAAIEPSPSPVPTRGRPLPVTALAELTACPRRFLLAEHLGRGAGASVELAGAALRGLALHRFVATYRPGDDLAEALWRSTQHVAATRPREFGAVVAALDPDRAVEALLPYAEDYLRSEALAITERARARAGEGVTVLDEVEFTLRLRGGLVSGRADRVILGASARGGRRALVLEFKTGGAGGADAEGADLQALTYALAARRLLSDVREAAARVIVLSGAGPLERRLAGGSTAERQAEHVLERAIAAAAETREPERFAPRPGPGCSTCPYERACPARAVDLRPPY